MAGRVFEAQQDSELTIIFTQIDIASALVSGEAGNITSQLRDEDGAASESVTITEQGTSGFYEANITPTKSSPTGHSYLLRMVSPSPATDGAILEYEIVVFPTLAVAQVGGTLFTTLANVKEYLDITGTGDDTLLSNLIARATRFLQDHFGRQILQATYTEFYDGRGSPQIMVREWPIVTVTSLHESIEQTWDASTLIAAGDYLIDLRLGRVRLKAGIFFPSFQGVRLIYDGGYATVPHSIEHATIEAVARIYRRRLNPDVVSWSLKDGAIARRVVGDLFKELRGDLSPWLSSAVA